MGDPQSGSLTDHDTIPSSCSLTVTGLPESPWKVRFFFINTNFFFVYFNQFKNNSQRCTPPFFGLDRWHKVVSDVPSFHIFASHCDNNLDQRRKLWPFAKDLVKFSIEKKKNDWVKIYLYMKHRLKFIKSKFTLAKYPQPEMITVLFVLTLIRGFGKVTGFTISLNSNGCLTWYQGSCKLLIYIFNE